MLRHLRVTNFAILSDVAIDLGPGFNALTGETGAGKSLIVEAVNLLRGGRASADIPREGAEQAVVEAIFDIPEDLVARVRQIITTAGLPDCDREVLVRRVIHRGGRSRTYVNGALTTAKRLAQLGAMLVDLSGQHQHQGLVDPKRHREILDIFGDHAAAVDVMRTAWTSLRLAEEAIAELGGDARAIAERTDYLRFQVDELEEAGVQPGEDDELDRELTRLQAVEKLETGARRAEQLLYAGDDAAVDLLNTAANEVEQLARIDDDLAEIAKQIDEARLQAEDAAVSLRRYADTLDGDPARLAEAEERLALLKRLVRKHGGTLEDVIARASELRGELEALENRDERIAELEAARDEALAAAKKAAATLTALRRKAADSLSEQVGAALADLGMAAASLSIVIQDRDLGADGADRVEVMLASNAGEAAKPLARIASGGELSRIMLAIKLCLRRADEVATYVFDEVDTGVGGATAEVVGRQIRGVADHRQVLCVTHLPQIAAFADAHFHVSKTEVDGRTETLVHELDGARRRDEMARMLGGARVTKRARAHADEMLQAARARA